MTAGRRRSLLVAGVLGPVLACRIAVAQTSAPPTEAIHPYTTPEEKRAVADFVLGAGLTVGGLVEVEAAAGREQGEDVSDLSLATLELGVTAEVSDWVRGDVVLLWEEEETEPVDLDVATVTLGGTAQYPFRLEAGKLYVPFGTFNSHFVSDPLVLELGETRASAAVAGYDGGMVQLRLGAFNGDLDADGDDDQVDDWVAALTLAPAAWISAGAYWMSDLGESDGLQEGLEAAVEGTDEIAGLPYDDAGGAGGFVSLQFEPFALEAEYLTALDEFEAGLLDPATAKPMAWNTELAWATTDALEFAVRYEGSDEFPGLPETQYGACATFALTDGTTLALEYLHGEYEGGTDDRDVATAQLAVEF